jgi:predicted nuclease of predicted toxin-antitoxin system
VNDLFIVLYLDEDVDVLLADLIRARGFAAVTTRDTGHLGATDLDQLSCAINQHRTFLTHNRDDFESLAREFRETGRHHDGIIVAVRHPPYELLRRLLRILNDVTADEMRDQIRYI